MNLPSILLWGFAATVLLTSLTIAGQSLGLTRIDIPFIIGTMFTPDRDPARVVGSWSISSTGGFSIYSPILSPPPSGQSNAACSIGRAM